MKVSICHASQDKQATRDLRERLLGAGHDVWFDGDLLPGQDWEREIRAAVRDSDAVVVLLSRHSVNKTGFVQREIRFVLDAADERPDGSIFLIPVRLDDAPVPERLGRLHSLDTQDKEWFDRLLAALRHVEGTSSGSGNVVSVSADPVVVELHGVDLDPTTVSPDQTVALEYRIQLRADRALTVLLGASLVGLHEDEHFDVSGDRHVSLVPGTAIYRRHRVTPPGRYRLVAAVWFRRSGELRLANLDRGFIVCVVEGTGTGV
jgi:hypothetical protein